MRIGVDRTAECSGCQRGTLVGIAVIEESAESGEAERAASNRRSRFILQIEIRRDLAGLVDGGASAAKRASRHLYPVAIFVGLNGLTGSGRDPGYRSRSYLYL